MTQPIMKPCLEQPSNLEWESHLRSWKRSSLSKAAYCRRKEISYHSFNYWKKRLEKAKPPSPITLVKLEGTEKMTSSFEKQHENLESPIRFWVKDFCIEVGDNFSKTSLVQLIETLRSI